MNAQASTSGRRRVTLMMGAVLIAASFLTALASPPSAARATTGDGSESKKGCVEFQIDFFPTRVLPGQGMDMDYSLANCSSMRERLVVPLRFKGPCPFIPSTVSRYTLGPQMGFGTSALIIAPDCRGHYRVKAQVLYRGRVLDHAVAGFTVLPTH